jgi:hypothetical protein
MSGLRETPLERQQLTPKPPFETPDSITLGPATRRRNVSGKMCVVPRARALIARHHRSLFRPPAVEVVVIQYTSCLLLVLTTCHFDPVQFLFDSMKGIVTDLIVGPHDEDRLPGCFQRCAI